MVDALIAISTTILFLLLTVICSAVYKCIRLWHRVEYIIQRVRTTMDPDQLLDQLLQEDSYDLADDLVTTTRTAPTASVHTQVEQQRARLAALVAGGTAKQYLGKQLSLADIDDLADDEIDKLYARYEARLGSTMTKTLGSTALTLYSLAAGAVLPIPPENRQHLVTDLESDPFVGHAVTTACCELYHRYGMYLAPLTAAMTTIKHCQFEDRSRQSNTSHDGGPGECRYPESDSCARGTARAASHSEQA
jgi:hypothetical protein